MCEHKINAWFSKKMLSDFDKSFMKTPQTSVLIKFKGIFEKLVRIPKIKLHLYSELRIKHALSPNF